MPAGKYQVVMSIHMKNINGFGSILQVGVEMKNVWTPHLDILFWTKVSKIFQPVDWTNTQGSGMNPIFCQCGRRALGCPSVHSTLCFGSVGPAVGAPGLKKTWKNGKTTCPSKKFERLSFQFHALNENNSHLYSLKSPLMNYDKQKIPKKNHTCHVSYTS